MAIRTIAIIAEIFALTAIGIMTEILTRTIGLIATIVMKSIKTLPMFPCDPHQITPAYPLMPID